MSLRSVRAQILQEGSDIALLVYGTILEEVKMMLPALSDAGIHPTVVNARFAKPIDRALILSLLEQGFKIVTVEEHVLACGFGSRVLEVIEEEKVPVERILRLGVPDRFVEHGDPGRSFG